MRLAVRFCSATLKYCKLKSRQCKFFMYCNTFIQFKDQATARGNVQRTFGNLAFWCYSICQQRDKRANRYAHRNTPLAVRAME